MKGKYIYNNIHPRKNNRNTYKYYISSLNAFNNLNTTLQKIK